MLATVLIAATAAGLLLLLAAPSAVCYSIVRTPGQTTDLSDKRQLMRSRWAMYSEQVTSGIEWILSRGEHVETRARDGVRLCGRYIENEAGRGVVIMFHGFRSRAHNDFCCAAEFYHSRGCSVLLVDERAHGNSGGRSIGMGVLERHDCIKWIEYVNERYGKPDIILCGVSMGATAVLMAAGMGLPENVKAIVSDCGFTSPAEIIGIVIRTRCRLPRTPIVQVAGFFSRVFSGYGYTECSTVEAMRSCRTPVLFIHGSEDELVPCEMSKRAFDALNAYKELYIVQGAAHAECFAKGAEEYKARVGAFLERCCGQ